ncbi:LysE family translocator [Amycolatopsis sp. EV170708-02-1]|uniref:LysE family translocator n=1 Tax=Amycolatopsis sp. EV170708-02-1 TaxID=2919322 RepID=UPI001F0C6A4A|nr:LysE family transporter [Amycolatopsis sp. EV170708-02-1]UMP06868.1 LysE family transporter [Amycolatopsis sp. EV170708-02-1]
MSSLGTLFTIVGVYLAAAVTPGPNFFYVAHTASTHSRRAALFAALGVATGSALLAGAGVLGATVLLGRWDRFDHALRLVCALYLAYLGAKILWSLRKTTEAQPGLAVSTWKQSYTRGLLTITTNPKAMIFFGSVLTALLPSTTAPGIRVAVVVAIAAASLCWHSVLALTFSFGPVRRVYDRMKRPFDLLSGVIFLALGASVIIW